MMGMRESYARITARRAQSNLLDEMVTKTGWGRKRANQVLLGRNT